MTRQELYTAITAAGVALHPCNAADTAPADDAAIYYMTVEELTGIYADIAEEQTTESEEKEEEKTMKNFMIYDCISNDYVRGMNLEAVLIQAGNGKSALQKFLKMYVMSRGMYEFHKRCNRWIMTSSFGSYFVAMPIK